MNNDCIMKPNDYIAASDVNKLTADQWQQFREYLRGMVTELTKNRANESRCTTAGVLY